jgi:deoxyribonuclease V
VWPSDADSLISYQQQLAAATPEPVILNPSTAMIGGCWVCFPRGLAGPGTDHDPAWSAAVIMLGRRVLERQVISGTTDSPYVPGLMALRVGRLMERTVRALSGDLDVLLLDATAGDHPRRAGLALHLGAELELPTIGVTHRPLVAAGEWPSDHRAPRARFESPTWWSAAGCVLRQVSGHWPFIRVGG